MLARHRVLWFIAAGWGALLSSTGSARAAGTLELTGAPTSTNGLTARVLGRHAETAYFNPALLPLAAPLVEVGFFVLRTDASIELDPRPASVDVPESIYDATLVAPDGGSQRLTTRPLPTASLPAPRRDTEVHAARAFALVGVVRPLFEQRLSFGMFAVLPLRGFLVQDGHFADEREQYFGNRLGFELLGDRVGVTTFALSIGGRLAPWLSAGLGTGLGFSTRTRFDVYVPDAADQRTLLLDPKVETTTSIAPVAAIALHPSTALTLTATAHAPTSVETRGENRVRFWNYNYPAGEDSVRQRYVFTQGYTPLRVGFGAAYAHERDGARRWELGTNVVISRWSQYVDHHGERPLDTWRNTLAPAVGGATALGPGRASLDVGLQPSPVPEQRGRTSYVDNARLMGSLGWERPLTVLGSPFSIGLYLHGQWLVPRSVTKRADAANPVLDEFPDGARNFVTDAPLPESEGLQTNNPGYPGYSSRGVLLGAGLAVRLPR